MVNSNESLFENVAIDFPILRPIVKHTTKPGPAVAAIPSISFIETSLLIAELIMNSIFSKCALAASSGTIHPNFSCSEI